jgi:hypothetical protein
MQKVVGSSPISRLESPANRAFSTFSSVPIVLRGMQKVLGSSPLDTQKPCKSRTFSFGLRLRPSQKVPGSTAPTAYEKALHVEGFHR